MPGTDGTTKHRSGATNLTDRIRITSFLCRYEAHEIKETGRDTKWQDDADVGSNLLESFDECVTDVHLRFKLREIG